MSTPVNSPSPPLASSDVELDVAMSAVYGPLAVPPQPSFGGRGAAVPTALGATPRMKVDLGHSIYKSPESPTTDALTLRGFPVSVVVGGAQPIFQAGKEVIGEGSDSQKKQPSAAAPLPPCPCTARGVAVAVLLALLLALGLGLGLGLKATSGGVGVLPPTPSSSPFPSSRKVNVSSFNNVVSLRVCCPFATPPPPLFFFYFKVK